MAISFRKLTDVLPQLSCGYDVWEVSNNFGSNPGVLGWHFVPQGVDGKDYHEALKSAEKKLISLGFNEVEAKAIIGRQLF